MELGKRKINESQPKESDSELILSAYVSTIILGIILGSPQKRLPLLSGNDEIVLRMHGDGMHRSPLKRMRQTRQHLGVDQIPNDEAPIFASAHDLRVAGSEARLQFVIQVFVSLVLVQELAGMFVNESHRLIAHRTGQHALTVVGQFCRGDGRSHEVGYELSLTEVV